MDKEYIPLIDIAKPVKEQNLKRKTIAIISALNLQYLCENEEKKQALKRMYKENGIKYQEELREKYNPDVFKNKNKITEVIEEKKEEISLANIESIPLYKRILNKILALFARKKINFKEGKIMKVENTKLIYFENHDGTWQESIKTILTNNDNEILGIRKIYKKKPLQETDQYGNAKFDQVEEQEELTEKQTQELYNFVITNINLFKSLFEKQIPENMLETGTITGVHIKYDNMEMGINTAIDGMTEQEEEMLDNLYVLIESFNSTL